MKALINVAVEITTVILSAPFQVIANMAGLDN